MASVRAYTPYTTVAEKLEAMVLLGEANSRLKDYHDLALLPRMLEFDGATLVESIRRTFAHRATPIPAEPLEGLSDSYAQDPLNTGRWRAFCEKCGLSISTPDLREIAAQIRRFAEPVLQAARLSQGFAQVRLPAGRGSRWSEAGHDRRKARESNRSSPPCILGP